MWGSAHTPLMFGFPAPDDFPKSLSTSSSANNNYHSNSGGTRRQASSESFEASLAALQETPLRVTVFDQVTGLAHTP